MNTLRAVLGSFAMLSSIACAQSNVNLYGVLDGGLVYSNFNVRDAYQQTNAGLAYGMQSGNRFGLKGIEDLGGGTSISFQLENGFNLGNGVSQQNSTLFGRQAWLGIEGVDLGYTRIGRQYNFATDYFGAIDPFNLGFGQASMGAAFGSTNMYRMSNTVKLQSIDISGFTLGAGYSFAIGQQVLYYNRGEQPNEIGATNYNFMTVNNNRQVTLGAKYAKGPVYLAASFDKLIGANEPNNNSGVSPSAWNLGAAYDFKIVKVALAYGQTRDGLIRGQGDDMTGASQPYNPFWGKNNSGTIDFNYRLKTSSYLAGVTVPVSSLARVFASWTYVADGSEGYQASQSAYNVGYSYDITKRTNIYAFFSYMNNVNTTELNRSSVLGLGMRHLF